jgi:hypothetical protein
MAYPAPQARDIARFPHGMRLAQETLHLRAVLERDGADAERRRNARHETGERLGRHLPDLNLDRCALRRAHQARPRRRKLG